MRYIKHCSPYGCNPRKPPLIWQAPSTLSPMQRTATITSHGIILVRPLAAFGRSTPKAQASSANLTRSATHSVAVLLLWSFLSQGQGGNSSNWSWLLPSWRANHYSRWFIFWERMAPKAHRQNSFVNQWHPSFAGRTLCCIRRFRKIRTKQDIWKDLFFIRNKMILIELEQWDKKRW